MSNPVNGADLAGAYYLELVAPCLQRHCPVRHAAARLGSGSDVLGFDDELSRDHDWGLRLNLFVEPEDVERVRQALVQHLPETFRDLPTRFGLTWSPEPDLRIEVATVETFVLSRLGMSAPTCPVDWLSIPGQSFLEVTAGPLFCDQLGELTKVRASLAWYPDQVWLFVLASALRRISQELPQVGRVAERGDDLGSIVLSSRIAQTIMQLGFLVERQWAPYPKWFGTAYARLGLARDTRPILQGCLTANWELRQQGLAEATRLTYDRLAGLGFPVCHNLVHQFHGRPYLAISDNAATLLQARITDPALKALPLAGSLEQWVSSVDILTDPAARAMAIAGWRQALSP